MTDERIDPRTLLASTEADTRSVVLFTRTLQSYDIDFASLDFVVEERLSPADRAVLALVQAMGQASADDVRTYLGLGWEVSPALVEGLAAKSLLQRAASVRPVVVSSCQSSQPKAIGSGSA